jgi:DNA-binding transcriptional LysR family regulator
MIDLRRLGHLVALADERHFARAAARVHLSQPAFSRSIQTLERDIGLRLFDRETGDVRPTPTGEFLIGRARQLLFDARCLQRDVALYGESELGDTAFGVGPFPAATLMPRVLPELRRRHPQVNLRVEVNNWDAMLARLHAEDIEFFIAEVRALAPDNALEIRSLGRQRASFHVRAGHPLAGKPCDLASVWKYGVASTRLPPVVKTALARLLGLADGDELVLALECDDVSLLQTVTLATDTVLGVSDVVAKAEVKAGSLLPLHVKDVPDLYSEMGIVSLRNRSHSPMADRAIELIAEVAAEVNR